MSSHIDEIVLTERIEQLNPELLKDIMHTEVMLRKYIETIKKALSDNNIIVGDTMVTTHYESPNDYEFLDDGNTSTEGVCINTIWMIPVRAKDVGFDINDLRLAHFKSLNYMLTGNLVGYIVLTNESSIRLLDGRYGNKFTTLHWYLPRFALDADASHEDNHVCIRRINDNYDKDYIFMDLKNGLKLVNKIESDFHKAFQYQEFLEIAKTFGLEPPQFYH